MKTDWDGAVELEIAIDHVWNKEVDRDIFGVKFESVYEIVHWKMDRMNVIGSVECTELDDYDLSFVVNNNGPIQTKPILVDFEFVAGGQLTLVCANHIEFLKRSTIRPTEPPDVGPVA